MKATTFFAISASLASLAVAAPFNKKRGVIFTTVTEEVVTTIWSTTTVWTNPTVTPGSKVGIFAESYASAVVPSVTTPRTTVVAASSAEVEAPVVKASTSTPVAIVNTYVAPAVPTSTYVAPAPAPATSTSVAVVAAASPAAAATSSAAAKAPVSNVASSGSYPYTGEITYYDVSVGLGSCGVSGSNSQDLVAIGKDMMANGINPNANPKCGKQIEISYEGNTHIATVFDTCPTCAGGGLDLTEGLFKKVAPNGDGRVAGVSWRFVN